MPRQKSNVWEYFERSGEVEGTQNISCNYCHNKFKTPNATKQKEHLLKCHMVPSDIKSLFSTSRLYSPLDARSAATPSIQFSNTTLVALHTRNSNAAISSLDTSSPSYDDPSNANAISSATRALFQRSDENLDTVFARAIYASGMPLSIFESKYWQEAFKRACPDYRLPSRASISGKLLEAEYIRVKENMDQKVTSAKALGLVLDGWTNIKGKSVVNFLLTTPDPVFIKSITPGTRMETAQFLAEEMKSVIEEVGSRRFVCVITDNASNMRAASRIIEEKFDNISCVGCAAHTFNLLFQDIAKKDSCLRIIRDCKKVIKYIKKRSRVLAFFTEKQKLLYGNNVTSLKLYSKTRWGGAVHCLKSFKENRQALELLAISEDVEIENSLKDIIVSAATWPKVDCCIDILSPIEKAISIAESNHALLSDIPHLFDEIKQTIETLLRSDSIRSFLTIEEKIDIVNDINIRREFILRPIHLAANLLDPRYNGINLKTTEFGTATDYLTKYALFLNQDLIRVMTNLAEFRTKSGFWNKHQIWLPVQNLQPRLWWQGLCDNQPIASIAIKILSVPPSSASAKRNWSLFARTHTKSRNRLTDERVNKLITISANLQYVDTIFDTTNIESDSDSDEPDVQNEEHDPLGIYECVYIKEDKV